MNVPHLVDIEQVSKGWVNKYVLTYEKENGDRFSYESTSRKGLAAYTRELNNNAAGHGPTVDAICIACSTADDQVLLIKEFRYPLNTWCVAFPAGLIDAGEDLASTVERELSEETGYRLIPGTTPYALPQAGYSSTGMTDESIQIVFAQVEKAGEAHTEENELIETFLLPKADIRSFLDTNTLAIGTRCQLMLELIYARYCAEHAPACAASAR